MIRKDVNTHWLLITQVDHAALAQRIGAHVGNRKFDRLDALPAVGLHDGGWPMHDDAPMLDGHGRPVDVFDTPRQVAMPIWHGSADRAEAVDPYFGLLVSLHSLSLSTYLAAGVNVDASKGSFDPSILRGRFELNQFQHVEIERQERLRKHLGLSTDIPLSHGLADEGVNDRDDRLRRDFRWLAALDLISLCLCRTNPPGTSTGDVHPRLGSRGVRLRIKKESERRFKIRPWPFGTDRVEVSVPARRMTAEPFTDAEVFRAKYRSATVEQLSFEILPDPTTGLLPFAWS